ncbi:LacI family DNA-binding transcriptional regulator [Streptomyces sp. NPDC007325]|uniref:LacI family DNA-binding transcriptional regulator n=1 Tax=Streptomyces sp. NPDC007325 TaxID=3154588 RepID=UPI0033D2DA5F
MTRKLAQVALRAGVSQATVSRVLNGRPGISEATRTTVLTALEALGYERPTLLRDSGPRFVGLVLPDLRNPVYGTLAELLASGLAQRGLTPVLCGRTEPGMSEAEQVERLVRRQVSGVVCAGGRYAEADASHQHYRLLAERGIPCVLVNAAVGGLGFPGVTCDDTLAAERAWRHLTSLGHERIGLLLGPADHVPSLRKLRAAAEAAEAASIPLPGRHVAHTRFSFEAGQAAAGRLLAQGLTGLICASDPLALGAVRAARRRGLTVSRDVSVVGFDDSPLMSCTDPPLTTVRQPVAAMTRTALDLLDAQLRGAAVHPGELLFEPELVVRASTARPAVRGNGPDDV